eukprot:m.205267 g.205267  ORF g.205267 m.205267 type:complete len:126 (+) comp39658_c0_seq16:896-1273(+)
MSKRVESPAICSSAQYSLGQNVQGQPACPHVPDLAYGLTMQRVLTMDFIDGCRVTDVAEIKNQGLNIPDVAGKFIECMSEQIFRTGFVHADPHPGNVLIRPRPKKKGEAEIVLLDHGLYMYVEPK